jgi:hypothetical protein
MGEGLIIAPTVLRNEVENVISKEDPEFEFRSLEIPDEDSEDLGEEMRSMSSLDGYAGVVRL